MAIVPAVHEALAHAGFRRMQHQRLGVSGCPDETSLSHACDWLFLHRQFEHHSLPGLVLQPTIASTFFSHDAPLLHSEPRYRVVG